MARGQNARLERKKFFSDPILVTMIVVLVAFLALFILYPLLMLLIDSIYSEGKVTLDVFRRVLSLDRFRKAFRNTLVLGGIVEPRRRLCQWCYTATGEECPATHLQQDEWTGIRRTLLLLEL